MTDVFAKVLNLSIVSSFLIVAVLILRLILAKAPKVVRYILWGMVALRLLIPFSFESSLSLIPNAQEYDSTSVTSTTYITPLPAEIEQTATTSADILSILSIVWIVGVAVMLLYMLISFIRVYKMVAVSVKIRDNIYMCDHLSSPFVLGIIKPSIYLNSSMKDSDSKYIIAHEQAHIRHLDHVFKPLGFILLSIYWFNPLCYLAYYLFVKDIELFCDESVIRTLDSNGKKEYSTVLLECGISSRAITHCPLAFSENHIKHRIKSILKYKKPTVYIVIASVVLCVVVLVLFMTNPVSAHEILPDTAVLETQPPTQAVTEAITEPQTEKPTKKPTQKPTESPTVGQTSASAITQQYNTPATQPAELAEVPTVAQQVQPPTEIIEVQPTEVATERPRESLSQKDAIKLDPYGRDIVHVAPNY